MIATHRGVKPLPARTTRETSGKAWFTGFRRAAPFTGSHDLRPGGFPEAPDIPWTET